MPPGVWSFSAGRLRRKSDDRGDGTPETGVVPFAPMTTKGKPRAAQRPSAGRPSALLDTRVIYCGDCLDQLRRLPEACVDLTYIDPPFNSNRNYEVFWGDLSEPRPSGSRFQPPFEDRHASTAAYIDYMRPRCVELARVLKKTSSFYYHCDWHASQYVKMMVRRCDAIGCGEHFRGCAVECEHDSDRSRSDG